ncbi:MAG: sporulation protein YunB [Clostridia bacterium]|nr:sporulation protein YunB [Clostridia bacterium]MBR4049673.1 sporulation protein YunB [Clostridia bacterium]
MKYRKPYGKAKKYIFIAVCLLLISLTLFLLIDARLRPMIRSTATVQAQSYAAVAAGTDIPSILTNTDTGYNSLVSIKRSADGNIVSIETDAMRINLLKSKINSAVAKNLSGLSAKELGIPIGSLTGLALLNGRGPKISTVISITGSAQTSFFDTFDDAGINQTRHQLFLKTTATMLIVFPGETVTAAYTYTTLVAETIIVGKVPEMYAGITQK